MRIWLVLALSVTLACGGDRREPRRALDSTAATSTSITRTVSAYSTVYDSLHRAPPDPFKLIATPLRECGEKPIDTLSYEILRFELKGDSIRGFLQDSIEGNAEPPVPFRGLQYDSIADVLTFSAATAARTLQEFQLVPSCESLTGILIWKQAQDARSVGSVHAKDVKYRRVRRGDAKP